MKERVRLSGLFPRVRNEPMSNQLQALMKEFENNAALAGILERRRRLEERVQYEMRSREAVAALNTNLAPPFRTGNAGFATSATVASKVADAPVPDAADVMTGETGKTAKAKARAAKAAALEGRRVRVALVPSAAAAAAGVGGGDAVVDVVGVMVLDDDDDEDDEEEEDEQGSASGGEVR